MSDSRDFSPLSTASSPTHNVAFDLESGQSTSHDATNEKAAAARAPRSEPDISHLPTDPVLKRRQTRANTSQTFRTVGTNSLRPNWHPGQEPGLDPSKPNGGRSTIPTLHENCQITVVDYSENFMMMHDLDNEKLIDFIDQKQESWIKCRWINVNGLSWDVIQALGKHKKLHRLALEDMVNTNNRTKADW